MSRLSSTGREERAGWILIVSPLTISRSVLTRAELDALPLDNNVKQEVERGKVSQDNKLVGL